MSSSHYDHEQDERDFYDRENTKRLEGCVKSAKMIGVLFILLVISIFLFSSCKTPQMPITSSMGTVISIDGDQVLVAFEVINKDKGSQGANWFYCPRHNYKKGDWYPNPEKDPTYSEKIRKEGSND